MISSVVHECLTAHKEPIHRLSLHARELLAFFFGKRFVLLDRSELGIMELLVESANPLPVAEAVLLLVKEAMLRIRVTPALYCALAVPWVAQSDEEQVLVLRNWLEFRLGTQDCKGVAVKNRPEITKEEALIHYGIWLHPASVCMVGGFYMLCSAQDKILAMSWGI